MSLASRLFGRLWRLPVALNHRVTIEPLSITMHDGMRLAADRYDAIGKPACATVLIRSCYGRGSLFKLIALLFAERGMQVIVQSCRGTGGSQGKFRPFFDEQSDGADTVAWLERQPWYSGRLALWGGSYLGNTAWAIAHSSAADRVQAMGLQVTLSNFRDRTYAFGGFTLEASLGWTLTMVKMILPGGRMGLLRLLLTSRRTRAVAERATGTLPLRSADRVVDPAGVSWWQDWMDHAEPNDPWWDAVDYSNAATNLPPTVMVTGWYDIFLPWQLKDFVAAQQAGREVRIVIGPWPHAARAALAESLRQSLALFQRRFGSSSHTEGDLAAFPAVRLYLMGANQWRDYPRWPIPGGTATTYFLGEGQALSVHPPSSESSASFDYDPSRPTPSLHGATLQGRGGSGPVALLERRHDVLIFTGEPLAEDRDVIGPIEAEIYLRSSTDCTDVYLCLCDVTAGDKAVSVSDGYVRLRPIEATSSRQARRTARQVRVEFWPTAYRFHAGHRIRVLVASGAHPRYARNLGSGEPLGDAHTGVVAHQEILFGPAHPSRVVLPVQQLRGM